jgi:SNF2 family DNA or RNA helicase
VRQPSDLKAYQYSTTEAILAREKIAVLQGVGWGKTASTLSALVERDEWPVLVVAPKRVAQRVWSAEAAEWEHTQNLIVTHLGGGDERRRRLDLDSHIETISYEGLVGQPDHPTRPFTGLTDEVRLEKRYRTIVFDELSKLKDPGTKRFRRLRAHAAEIPYRIGLTGTPIGNHLLDLWGEMFMVAGAAPLGETYSGYRQRYFAPVDYFQRDWQIKDRRLEKEIHLRCAPWIFTLPPQPEVEIPPLQVNQLDVEMPASVVKLSKDLQKKLFVELASGVELEALSGSTLAAKLRQFAGGSVYTEGEKWEVLHDEKLDVLEDVVDELQGEPLLVFYHYKHEAERIRKRLGKRVVGIDEKGAIDRWNRREIEVLLVHPASAGHGLNLQHGGSTIFWFTLPWSHELWIQANGRLARTGQKAPRVMVHVPLCGPLDRYVLETLGEKGATERRLLDTLLSG